MSFPLYLRSFIEDDKQFLELYRNRERIIVPPPIQPYTYNTHKLKFNDTTRIPTTKRLMSDTSKLQSMYKYSHKHSGQISWINNQSDNRLKQTLENHVLFTHRCLIDTPDFFDEYGQTEPLQLLTVDIETKSKDGVYEDEILLITYAINDDEPIAIYSEVEQEMLEKFRIVLNRANPDVIITYNGDRFDLPIIKKRMDLYQIPFWWGRNRSEYGRVSFDVWKTGVAPDQTLFKLRDRKLKSVAPHFGQPMICEDTRSTVDIPTDKLIKYGKSDIVGTRFLYHRYFPKVKALCEKFKVPLNIACEQKQAFFAKLWSNRLCYRLGIVSDGTNKERHHNIYKKLKKEKYQGAIIHINKPNQYFKKVWKVDFSGMYPSIAMSLNLGVDTCKIVGTRESEPFSVIQRENDRLLSIPDDNLGGNFLIRILNEPSVFTTELVEMKKLRKSVKKLRNETEDENKWIELDSEQNSYKVLSNSWIGINGESSVRPGDLSVVIPVAGGGRWCINKVRGFIKLWYGDIEICTHTDGTYLSEDVDIDLINNFIKSEFNKFFLVDDNDVILEKETFGSAWFYRAPAYMFRDLDGTAVIKGGVFLDSRHPPVVMDFVDEAAEVRLDNGDPRDLLRRYQNLGQFETERFVKSLTLGKDNYADTTMIKKIQGQARLAGLPITQGTSYEYVKTKVGFQILPLVTGRDEVDEKYYFEILEGMAENFGWKNEWAQVKVTGGDKTLDCYGKEE